MSDVTGQDTDGGMPTRITRTGALKAAFQGGEAARAGEQVTACPFDITGPVVEEFHAVHWVRGYRAAATA